MTASVSAAPTGFGPRSWRRCSSLRCAACGGTEIRPDDAATLSLFWRLVPGSGADGFVRGHAVTGSHFVKIARSRLTPSLHGSWQAFRLLTEARALRRLRRQGIPVPEVLLSGSERFLGLPLRAVLVLRHIEHARTLRAFLTSSPSTEERSAVFAELGRVVTALHAEGTFHRDLSPRNILVRRGVSRPEIALIDCPRAERGRWPLRRGFLRRSEAHRLARGLRRAGASAAEIESALPPLTDRERARVLARASVPRGSRRRFSARWTLFLWFGI